MLHRLADTGRFALFALIGLSGIARGAAADSNPPLPNGAAAQAEMQVGTVLKDKAEPRFTIQEYRVLGNTVLDNRQIERVLYPLLGSSKSSTDVETGRAALEQLYHERGFGAVYVDIPPQTITDGIVRLRVTEGRIERTVIGGARYFPERDVIAQLPAAKPGQVLQVSELQTELAALNVQTADRSVVPILKAGSEPGTVDVQLQVNDKLPLHGTLEINNQATIDTHPLRSIASLTYDDLFGRMDTLSLQYQTTPQQFDQVRVLAANYAMHPLASGLQPSFSYINSNSNVATIGTLGVLGIGEISGIHFAYALPSTGQNSQSLVYGVDYKHFRNTINQNATTALDTPITYLNLSVGYVGVWRSEHVFSALNFGLNAGPRGFVNNSPAFDNDRFQGRANYFDLRADWSSTITLPESFSLKLRAAGQAAGEPLITNEDFSIAGSDGVRGYLESEELGDKAFKATVQLNSPGLHAHERTWANLYLFADSGRAWVIDPLAGQPTGIALRSWGGGIDVLPLQKLTGSLTWARPLSSASVTRAGESRFLFTVRGAF
jgi:hemolysin activation/secretion protein